MCHGFFEPLMHVKLVPPPIMVKFEDNYQDSPELKPSPNSKVLKILIISMNGKLGQRSMIVIQRGKKKEGLNLCSR